MKTVMINGRKYVEVLVSQNNCEIDGVWCGYKRGEPQSNQSCRHPEAKNPGMGYCSDPPRMFVLPKETMIFVRARLTS